jgi:hypothetical protein
LKQMLFMNGSEPYEKNPLNALHIVLGRQAKLPIIRSVMKAQAERENKPVNPRPPEVPKGAKSLAHYRRTCGATCCLSCKKPISQNKKYCVVCTPGGDENKASEIDVLRRMVAEQTKQ